MVDQEVMLITGTRKGIGKDLAEHYLKKGYFVVGCSRGEGTIVSGSYQHYCLDVSDESAVRAMLQRIASAYGRLDVVINNAGVASMNHVMLTPVSSVEEVFRTNFFGTFLVCREASKIMSKSRYGRIVNFSTIAVPLKIEGEAVYAASKGAIETFTKIFAKEVARFNITCNCICPTLYGSDMLKLFSEEKINAVLEMLPIKRFATIDDISNATDFLISRSSCYITGQTIYLGGISE